MDNSPRSSSQESLDDNQRIQKTSTSCSLASLNTENVEDISREQLDSPKMSNAGQEKQDIDSISDFPDGGTQAWTVVLGGFFGFVSVFGILNSVGAIEAYISQNQLRNVPTSTVSWIFSIYTFVLFFSGIFAGCFFDRNGCSYINYIGSAFSIVGLFTMANSTKVWHFILSFSICYALGSGILLTSLISAVCTWFSKKINTATALASLGGSIGGIVFPVMLRKLYSEIGFPNAIRVLASIVSLCLIISCLITRENHRVVNYVKSRNTHESKKDVLKVYATDSINLKYFLEPKFLFCCLGCACAESGSTVAATYFASYCLKNGYTQSQSYTFITVLNAFGILGRSGGFLADLYVGRFQMLFLTMTLAGIFSFVLWLPFGDHKSILYAYCALYGFLVSSFLSLSPPAVGAICNIEDFGKKFSTMYCFVSVFCIPIMELGGVIIGQGSDGKHFDHYVIFCACIITFGGISYLCARLLHNGFKWGKF